MLGSLRVSCLLWSLAAAHNWLQTPRSRGGGASTGYKQRPAIRDPHIQIGDATTNQTFVASWSTGHAGGYWFVVMHRDDEDKMHLHKPKNHGGYVLDDYIADAPPEAYIYTDPIYQKWHVSCSYLYAYDTYDEDKRATLPGAGDSATYPGNGAYVGPRTTAMGYRTGCDGCPRCGGGYWPDDGTHVAYESIINESDPRHYTFADPYNLHTMFSDGRADSFRGYTHFALKDDERSGRLYDRRVSYHNPKYPWIEALHYFHNYGARPREWDAARFSMPAKRGSGEYIVQMVWAGYRDVIDVDVLPAPAVDIYGAYSTESVWTKTDHCQYVSHGPPTPRRWPGTCFPVTDAYAAEGYPRDGEFGANARYTRPHYDVSACMDMAATFDPDGLNVVPLRNPALVADTLKDWVNIPQGLSASYLTDCDFERMAEEYPEAFARNDTLICYWVTEGDDPGGNPEVDLPWTIVDDDPEDPVFYSTCFTKQSAWRFVGNPPCPACDASHAAGTTRKWKYGEYCVSCELAEHYAHVTANNQTVAPWWEFADTCENCDKRW